MGLPPRLAGKSSSILSYFTRHHTIANLLMAVGIIAGLLAATQLRSQFFPDVVIDSVSVSVRWDGAGPEDIDGSIVGVLEPAVLSVEGVTSSTSVATEGSARISLEFEPGWDMARAADDVKQAVDAVTNLPENVEDPVVRRGAWRDRVTDVVISGPVAPEQLARYADELSLRLFREGVTRTTIRGVADPVVRVEIPQRQLVKNDVSLQDVSDVIAQEAQADPAGDVAGGTARVRTGVAKRDAEDIGDIVVRSNDDGSKLRVADLGTVSVDAVDGEVAFFKGDNPAVSIRVDRADLGDSVEMQAIVQQVADAMELELPQGVTVELIRTRAQAITDRLNILLTNGAMGLVLVIGLLFLFLNVRTAFWVAAGIPVAMITALAFMYMAGLTLNIISLFGLIICLGIVVDDAIVVGEHADFRHRNLGENPINAAENAATRMASPVFSATLTTIIAFSGLALIEGRFGSLIADIPFTVAVVLAASLIEVFLILPHHMSRALTATSKDAWYDWPSRQFNRGFRWVREGLFKPLISWVIALRYPVIAGAIAMLSLVLGMFFSGDVSWRFFNAPERGSITGNIAMLHGASREDTRQMLTEMQRATEKVASDLEAEHGDNPVVFSMVQLGGTSGRPLAGQATKDADLLGSISIELIDADLRPYSSAVFLGTLQDEVRKHPLLETLSFRSWASGPGGDTMDVSFFGADAQTLKDASERLKTDLEQFGEVTGVEDDLPFDKAELVLELTPQGKQLGFSIDGIGRELYQRLNGIDAAEFPVGARTGTIKVGLPEGELTADFLEQTRLRTAGGAYVILSDIVTVDETLGFSQVIREDGLQRINVTGDIAQDDPVRASEITDALRFEILPQIASDFGVQFQLGGLAEQENEFLSDAMFAFLLCLLGIYLVLSWIFASWARPLVVMAIIPFGLIGTIWGHYVWDIPLSMFTVVGLIGMTGIIINDSIVLVSTIDEYAKSRGIVPAVIDATADRLRAVVLTTLTTVLGLTPLLYETSQQAQFLKPTVITLSYGLGVGMFIVLLIVPALVVVQQDVGRLLRAYRRASFGHGLGYAHRAIVLGCSAASLGVVAATVGSWVMNGGAPGALARAVQSVADMPPLAATWVALIAGLIVVMIVGLILSAQFLGQRQRAS
jgi:multidrug efflux pump subunit AcrB